MDDYTVDEFALEEIEAAPAPETPRWIIMVEEYGPRGWIRVDADSEPQS